MANEKALSTEKELPMYDYSLSHDVNEARFTEYKAGIQRLYDSGKPLFTKEAIRDLVKQLETPQKSIERLRNKNYVHYKVKRYDDVEVEHIYAEPEATEYQEEEMSSHATDDDSPGDADNPEDDDNAFPLYEKAEPESFEDMLRKAEDDIISITSQDEYVSGRTVISYGTAQELLSKRQFFHSSDDTGCTLGIWNVNERLDRTTNKLLTPKLRRYDDAVKLFEADMTKWESSDACQKLKDILGFATLPSDIRKIVNFSSGSAMHAEYSLRDIHRTNYQHAVILTIREILGLKGEQSSVVCFAQDPAYKEGDKVLLKSKGVEILDDPDGFLEVDDSSVVISCSSNVPVKQIICDLARPAIMIWDRDDGETNEELMRINQTDPYSPRLRDMIDRHYDTYEFPGDRQLFGEMSIFVRRSPDQKSAKIEPETGSQL